jgi:hypothetical protein
MFGPASSYSWCAIRSCKVRVIASATSSTYAGPEHRDGRHLPDHDQQRCDEGIARSEHDGWADQRGRGKRAQHSRLAFAAATDVRRGRPRIRADAGNMHEPLDACLAGKLCHSFGGPHMDGLKCIFPSLHVEAHGVEVHGVNDSPAPLTALATGPPSFTSAWSDTMEPSSEAGKRARSGCRVAIRTAKPLSCRWRAMRRPRNPVPPNTVTTCLGTRLLMTRGGWYRGWFKTGMIS